MANVLVVTEHMKGEFQDISFEMLGQARKLAAGGSCSALVYGSMKDRASELGAADRVLCLGGSDDFNPEAYFSAARQVIQSESPDLVLVGSSLQSSIVVALFMTPLYARRHCRKLL